MVAAQNRYDMLSLWTPQQATNARARLGSSRPSITPGFTVFHAAKAWKHTPIWRDRTRPKPLGSFRGACSFTKLPYFDVWSMSQQEPHVRRLVSKCHSPSGHTISEIIYPGLRWVLFLYPSYVHGRLNECQKIAGDHHHHPELFLGSNQHNWWWWTTPGVTYKTIFNQRKHANL